MEELMFGTPLFMSSLLDVPRPYIDAVTSSTEALGIAGLVFERPRRESTIVLVLDAMSRGIHLNRFTALGVSTLHKIIADCSELPHPRSIVLFSSRTTSQSLRHDQSLLHLSRTMLHNAGLELQQWIVTGPGEIYCSSTYCPGTWSTTSSRT